MVGEDYFRRRLGDIYELSPVPYLHGTGIFSSDVGRYDVEWELNAAITGNHTLVLSMQEYPDFGLFGRSGQRFTNWTLEGTTSDGEQTARSTTVMVHGMSPSPTGVILYCRFKQMRLERPSVQETASGMEAQIMNLALVPAHLRVELQGRNIDLRLNDSHQEIRQLLNSGRIDRAIMSTLHLPVNGDMAEVKGMLSVTCYP